MHEAEAAAPERLDVAGPPRVVAQGGPQSIDQSSHPRAAHDHAGPERAQQLRPRHDALAVSDQVEQHVERARLDRHGLPAPEQPESRLTDLEFPEAPRPHVHSIAVRRRSVHHAERIRHYGFITE